MATTTCPAAVGGSPPAPEWTATTNVLPPAVRRVKRGLRIRPRPFRLIRNAEDEIRHLREVAEAGESEETPVIVIGMVVLVLLPVFALVLGGAFAAYYLS